MTQNLGRIGEIHAYTSVWIPNFILLLLVFYSSYKMQKEKPFTALDKISDLFITLYEFSRGIFRNSIKPKSTLKKTKTTSLDAIVELRKETGNKKIRANDPKSSDCK